MAILVLLSAFLFFQAAAAHTPVGLLEATWGLVDEGEVEPFSLLLKNDILKAASGSRQGELYGLGATLACVSELSWVRPASACSHANLINTNVDLAAGRLGRSALSAAIDGYAVTLAKAVENIRILGQCCVLPSPWPTLDNSCGDYGRIYDFENSWDLATSFQSADVRCSARDLYLALTARPNNVGAAATSAATSPALQIFELAEHDIINLLTAATQPKVNCAGRAKQLRTLAGIAKSAIFDAADSVKSNCYRRCSCE